MSNRPLKTFRSGVSYGVQIALWQNENGRYFSVKKTYKDKAGEWKESNSLYTGDLAALAILAPQAIAYADSLPKFEQGVAAPAESNEAKRTAADDDDIPF